MNPVTQFGVLFVTILFISGCRLMMHSQADEFLSRDNGEMGMYILD